jgi:hypothetical protein
VGKAAIGVGDARLKPPSGYADDGRMKGFMRVSVGVDTTGEEVQALERVFRLAEIPVLVEDEIARFDDDSPWVMYVSAPIAWFSSRFARAGADAPAAVLGAALAGFVGDVSGVFRAPIGSVVFTDEPTEAMIGLTSDLPEAAYQALLGVELGGVEGERISWNADEQAWYTLRGEACPSK